MLVDERLEPLIGGDIFLDGGDLVARYVLGDIAAILTVLEGVVGLAVRTNADDGKVAAFHAGDGGQLLDALGNCFGLHGASICACIYLTTKK